MILVESEVEERILSLILKTFKLDWIASFIIGTYYVA
jgi:hypothetical protein